MPKIKSVNTLYRTALKAISLLVNSALTTNAQDAVKPATAVCSEFKVAFGSCGKQDHPLPIFHEVIKQNPDMFVFLGDNIYGDTDDMTVLRAKYDQLGAKPSYQALKRNTEIFATWDDHDYGKNDAGKEYKFKDQSKTEMLRFFDEPKDSERFKHPGVYHSIMREFQGKKIQLILLDLRTFRDPLVKHQTKKGSKRKSFYRLDYAIQTDKTSTVLGDAQWAWLEQQLNEKADFRLIASGSQFAIEHNGYESWANFPHEQNRFLELIKKTRAEHLVFITGDVHYAEISKRTTHGLYPIYDFTSSGLSSKWKFATPNKFRIEGPIMENHFGLLTINFSADSPSLKSEIWDITGNQRIEYTIPLSDLKFSDE